MNQNKMISLIVIRVLKLVCKINKSKLGIKKRKRYRCHLKENAWKKLHKLEAKL